DGIAAMQETMAGASSAADVADARMNTLSGRFQQLVGSLQTLGIVMGGLGEGPLSGFLEMATNAVNSVTAWAEANPRLAQTIMLVVAAIAAIGPVLIIVGQLITAISTIASVVGSIGGIATAFTALGAAISGALTSLGAFVVAMGPIGWLIAGIVAVIVLLIMNWERLSTTVQQIGFILQHLAGQAFNAVRQGLQNLQQSVQNFTQNAGQRLQQWA
ncbi:MAG: phage tail tape measure protein, partial [Chloroflexota bacterium]